MLFEPIAPKGFLYIEDIVTPEEERKLIEHTDVLHMHPYVMRGQPSRRLIARFGHNYGNVGGTVDPPPPIPEWLLNLRDRTSAAFGVHASQFVSALVTRYPPGATIGWHRDLPMFGSVVLGVSCAAECMFRLRPRSHPRRVISFPLAPRSAYALTGEVRSQWEHSIPPVAYLRYSVTFRSLTGKKQVAPNLVAAARSK